MDRPAPTPPRRRWWHRYAVLESNHKDGIPRVVCYHATRAGAIVACGELYAHYGAIPNVAGWFEWRVHRARHRLVLRAAARPLTSWGVRL